MCEAQAVADFKGFSNRILSGRGRLLDAICVCLNWAIERAPKTAKKVYLILLPASNLQQNLSNVFQTFLHATLLQKSPSE